MTAFLSDYISYIQESRVKSEELDYYQMNQYFWKEIDKSHWREKRPNFYRNYDLVLHKFGDDADKMWERQVKNFIARDNLLHYLPKVDKSWVEANIDMLGFDTVNASLVRSRPVVFLSFHNFYQVLIPMVLAQYNGPVSSFVLDEAAEGDKLVQTYMLELYKGMRQGLNGGDLLKVGAENSERSKQNLSKVLKRKGCIYAAIDMVHPLLGSKTKVSLKSSYFEMEVLSGVINAGVEECAQFIFPFISLVRDGTLRFEMFTLNGSTTELILESYREVL